MMKKTTDLTIEKGRRATSLWMKTTHVCNARRLFAPFFCTASSRGMGFTSIRNSLLTASFYLLALSPAIAAEEAPGSVKDHPWLLIVFFLGGVIAVTLAVFLWNFYLQNRVNKTVKELEKKNEQLVQSQEDIRRSEHKFRLIFENAPYAIVIFRLDDGTILDASKAFLERRGVRKKDLHKMSIMDLVVGSEKEKQRYLDRIRKEGALHNEPAIIYEPDGSHGHIFYSTVLLEVDGELQGLSMALNVTKQKQAQEALVLSEEKFRNVFNSAPVGIFRSTFDGRLIEANDTLARFLGYENREQILSRVESLGKEIYPNEMERQRILDALLESPEGIRMEAEYKRQGGKPVYGIVNAKLSFDENGNPAWIDGAIEDVTRIKQAAMETRKLAAAVEQSSDIIVITDPKGVIQYVNPAFEKITGYSRAEALGQTPRVLKSGKHDQAFYEDLWQTILVGETWKGNIINKRKDGSLFTEKATISPMVDDNGEITNFVASKRDITDEMALREQNRQMQKMEALGRLTGGVAHDFNNLLQAMNGFVELAGMDLPQDHRSRPFLEQTLTAGRRAANLVQQLLLFSRKKDMQFKYVDLNTAVDDLLKMVGRIIGTDIQVQWRPWNSSLTIHADPGMMDQVLMNLCVNARDAMPDGGVLTIATSIMEADAPFCAAHSWAKQGRYAVLKVGDTGMGMDEETLDRIFEPFFTTKEEGRGTGLGLATAYGVVQQHGGMISVSSELGKGSEFTIFLPLVGREVRVINKGVVEKAAGGDEIILIVEDDAMVRQMAAAILEKAGYTVLEAGDGREAVNLFKLQHDRLSLVILDITMPNLTGKEAFEEIRRIKPEMPVLVCSAYDEGTDKTDFVAKEGLSYLQKPYSANTLLKTVRKIIDHGPLTGILPEE